MSWRKVAGAFLFSPIMIGLFVFVALLIVWKLPMICCERRRAVRYLPWAGLAYYGVLVLLMALVLPLVWWEILVCWARSWSGGFADRSSVAPGGRATEGQWGRTAPAERAPGGNSRHAPREESGAIDKKRGGLYNRHGCN